MTYWIDIQTLDFDVSNKCGNTCQWCYHNKVLTEDTTSIHDFQQYISKFFRINKRSQIESFSLYWWNILENTNLKGYLDILQQHDTAIDKYIFSTSFWSYNYIAKTNQKYLLSEFMSDKKFIFQYFFHPDYVNAYIESCKDLLSYGYQTHVFFSVQLVEIEKEYLYYLIKQLRRFFIALGCTNKSDLKNIEKNIFTAIQDKDRTENFEIQIGTYTFLIMVLHPVRKEKNIITSVCWESCSFFSSSSIEDNIYTSTMLSIEYNGVLNFHNPNCVASMQRICNIKDSPENIERSLKNFYNFLRENIFQSKNLQESCNSCLKHNLKKK